MLEDEQGMARLQLLGGARSTQHADEQLAGMRGFAVTGIFGEGSAQLNQFAQLSLVQRELIFGLEEHLHAFPDAGDGSQAGIAPAP